MIQDIGKRHFHNEFHPEREPRPDSLICCFKDGQILAFRGGEETRFPTLEELSRYGLRKEDCTWLFSVDDEWYFLFERHLSREMADNGHYRYIPVREMAQQAGRADGKALAAYTARQLAAWYRDNRYCGTCGSTTERATDERAIVCPGCGRRIYPRIVPAVIIGVTRGNDLLLTKYAGRGAYKYYALVAGFTEIGESLEENVAREVMEEVGLRVTNIRYYKSQPWGIVDDLLMGFYCDVEGDDEIRLDPGELKEALWVPREEIEDPPTDLSLTGEMMVTFREGKEPK